MVVNKSICLIVPLSRKAHQSPILRAGVASIYSYTVLVASIHNYTVLEVSIYSYTVLEASIYSYTVLEPSITAIQF